MKSCGRGRARLAERVEPLPLLHLLTLLELSDSGAGLCGAYSDAVNAIITDFCPRWCSLCHHWLLLTGLSQPSLLCRSGERLKVSHL